MSDIGDDEQVGSYAIFFAEGETLAKQRQFTKAIESFTKVSVIFRGVYVTVQNAPSHADGYCN